MTGSIFLLQHQASKIPHLLLYIALVDPRTDFVMHLAVFSENPFACIDLLIRSKREDREIWGFCDKYLILVALAEFCLVAEPLGLPLLGLTVSGITVPLRKRVLLA